MSTFLIAPRKCGARSKHNGEPCQINLGPGEVRCRLHGGATPQARAKTRRRLEGLADGAVSILEAHLLTPGSDCALCGRGTLSPMALRAAMTVLDRTGYGPQLQIKEASGSDWQPLVDEMTDEEFALVDGVIQRVQARVEERRLALENEDAAPLVPGNVHPVAEALALLPEPESAEPVVLADPADAEAEEF